MGMLSVTLKRSVTIIRDAHQFNSLIFDDIIRVNESITQNIYEVGFPLKSNFLKDSTIGVKIHLVIINLEIKMISFISFLLSKVYYTLMTMFALFNKVKLIMQYIKRKPVLCSVTLTKTDRTF